MTPPCLAHAPTTPVSSSILQRAIPQRFWGPGDAAADELPAYACDPSYRPLNVSMEERGACMAACPRL